MLRKFKALLIINLIPLTLFAQNPINENPVTVHSKPLTGELKWGVEDFIEIEMTVEPGHHAYTDMIKAVWKSPEGAQLGTPLISPTVSFMDKFSKRQREGVEKFALIKIPITLPNGFPSGSHSGSLDFTYQVCSESYCLFPKTINLPIKFSVNSPSLTKNNPSPTSFENIVKKGKLWTYIFVFFAGVLTCLTPCIFPMIPITISIIGAKAASHHSRWKGFFLSLSYVFGIATTYSLLGLLAASTGTLFGSFLGNFWFVLALFVTFVAMSLSMFGFYEIQAPHFIRKRFGTASTGTGFTGAYVGGIFAGVVASPCVGPILVSILTFVAQSAQLLFGFTLLFTYAMGLGMLFLLVGTFSHSMVKLPKSGPWLDEIKNIFGVTFLALGFYYLKPVVPEKVFVGLAGGTAILVTSALGAFSPVSLKHKYTTVKKGVLVGGFLLSLFWMGSTYFPQTKAANSSQGQKQGWVNYSDELFSKAKTEKKPIIIDFSAEWCLACHELDEKTLNQNSVITLGKSFAQFSVDATEQTPLVSKLQKEFNVVGLPTIIFIDHNGKVREDLTVTGFVSEEVFAEKMRRTLEN